MSSPTYFHKPTCRLVTATLALGAALAMPISAMAGGVDWSVQIGAPLYGAPVVVAPQPVYVAPPPIVVAPQPVYYSGYVPYGQVVYYDPWNRPYYVAQGRSVYLRGWREGHGYGHDRDHDHDRGHHRH